MKNFFLGLAVVAIAFSASAFTNVKVSAGDSYGSISTTEPIYKKLTEALNTDLCEDSESFACYYTVTTAGAGTVTGASYTIAQLEAYANITPLPYVTRSAKKGYYTGN